MVTVPPYDSRGNCGGLTSSINAGLSLVYDCRIYMVSGGVHTIHVRVDDKNQIIEPNEVDNLYGPVELNVGGPTPTPTRTPTGAPTETPVPATPVPTSTNTPLPTDTATPTSMPLPTDTPTATSTPQPTDTPTVTPLPTDTPVPTDTATATPTFTPVPPTNTPVPSFPDLVIDHISVDPSEPTTDDDIYVEVYVKNQGNTEADWSTVAVFINGNPEDDGMISSLDPNETKSEELHVQELPAGEYQINIVADSDEEVTEADEGNNSYSFTLTVTE